MDGGNKISGFQVIVLFVFGFAILAGVVVFALYRANAGSQLAPVTIWGTLPEQVVQRVLTAQADTDSRYLKITYVEKDAGSFAETLANALAAGTGPDLFILPQDLIVREQDKLLAYPYGTYPKKTFTDSFIDEAQLFLGAGGVLALPVVVDPLVLYWNKDMLSKYGFAQPPAFWEDVFGVAEKISIHTLSGTVSQSAIALGEASNIVHAKDILSMLVQQAGGKIVTRNSEGDLQVVLGQNPEQAAELPAISALRFYTTFANPAETVYSWNRSLPEAADAFTQGKLALYLGPASEFDTLVAQNPNLRFDVAPMPQIKGAGKHVTAGRLYAVALSRASSHPQDAATVASLLASPEFTGPLAQALNMAPTLRSQLALQVDGEQVVFNQMALIAAGWLDPNPVETDRIMTDMITSVTSGGLRLSDAVNRAGRSLEDLIQ